jgi:hypothetical protein
MPILANGGSLIAESLKKPSNFPQKTFKKFKRNDKKTARVMREGGKTYCTHCKKSGHDEEHCWKLHPEKKLKQFGGKRKTKTVATIQQDLGFDLGDEEKITTVGVQGKDSLHASSSSNDESHVDA